VADFICTHLIALASFFGIEIDVADMHLSSPSFSENAKLFRMQNGSRRLLDSRQFFAQIFHPGISVLYRDQGLAEEASK
jgi:hypothetical protein